ncbi:protein kinase domain-containing protein [Amycolatopsis sp. lyj-84]|uniref:serine/threonine-protein kinase n=1 Tax=Amycolatopsis sp. lyj-84 TaxID=2789284 RepID=UPI00397BCA7A
MKPLNPGEPRQVGRYRLVAALGEGGMGRVLLGVSQDGRLIALKQVHPGFAHDEGFRSRFRREVQTSRMVSGAYTAAVMDADPDAPTPWLASVFVPGPSLREAVDAAGPLPPDSLRFLAVGLASALTEIHRAGLVHRDLKPSNVILTDDGPRVIDFGIARAVEGETDITHTGSIIGSPGFMSPEQANGHPVTPASDVFSLGALLVMAATGQSPFAGTSTPQTLYNVVHSQADLRMLHPAVRRLAEPCLAKDPAARPTPAQILDFLGAVTPSANPWPPVVHASIAAQKAMVNQALSLPTPVEETPSENTQPKKRGRAALVIAMCLVVLLGVTTAVVISLTRSTSQQTGHGVSSTSASPPLPPPDPFNPVSLRKVDPCALLGEPDLAAAGQSLERVENSVKFEECAYSIKDPADPSKPHRITLNLGQEKTAKPGATRLTIEGLEATKFIDNTCTITVTNPADSALTIHAWNLRTDEAGCSSTQALLAAAIKKLRTGGDIGTFPEESFLNFDPCTFLKQDEVESLAGEVLTTDPDGLHECTWRGTSSYVVGPFNVSMPTGRMEGQNILDVSGVRALEEHDEDSCSVTWLHRKTARESFEQLRVRVNTHDGKITVDEACKRAKDLATLVIAKLPKP